MISRKITYTDYNGTTRTEMFYFNLNKLELTKLNLQTPGGFMEYVERISDAKDEAEIFRVFEELIDMSFGIKSPDGKRFQKSEEILAKFKESPAYIKLFESLVSNPETGITFLKGILPQDAVVANKTENDSKSETAALTTTDEAPQMTID